MAKALWRIDSVHGRYSIWKKKDGMKTIYNATTTGRPPGAGDGGYYSKASLLKLKGVK